MTKKPKKELDLSPFVMEYWEEKGYCVHGEVAIFGYSTFIDHVAHTGPCKNPDYVVGIEMKKGAGKSLRKQLFSLDTKHVTDELWGAVISTPREGTLNKWEGHNRWNQPGLLVWEDGKLEEVMQPDIQREYKRTLKKEKLLLIQKNRKILAGYPSGHEKNNYVTHWSYTKQEIERKVLANNEPVSSEDLWENLPNTIDPYSNKRAAFNKMLRVLEDEEKKIRVVRREGRTRFFSTYNEDDPGWDVDPQFDELFEIKD